MASPFEVLHHVCVVVPDLDAAVAYYESAGIGPWHDYPPLTQYTELDVPDREGFLGLRYAYTDLANVQLQVVEPGTGPSPQREFLENHGPGVFHLGFSVPHLAHAVKQAADLGIAPLMSGRRDDGSGFTYFDTAVPAGVVLEVRQSGPSS